MTVCGKITRYNQRRHSSDPFNIGPCLGGGGGGGGGGGEEGGGGLVDQSIMVHLLFYICAEKWS